MSIVIKKGLSLRLSGSPVQSDIHLKETSKVSVNAADFIGVKPKLLVQIGDKVQQGDALFINKSAPDVLYTASVSGKIIDIVRGEKRALQHIVIEQDSAVGCCNFAQYSSKELVNLDKESITEQLLKSGAWTYFLKRPFGHVPNPNDAPNSIFVTVTDTRPLAVNPVRVLTDSIDEFNNGLTVISKLTAGKTFVCHDDTFRFPHNNLAVYQSFTGKHPSGLAGTHIHYLDPVGLNKQVWTIDYQDVIAIGRLFVTGKLDSYKVISLSGSQVVQPRLLKVLRGSDISELTHDELIAGNSHLLSGSVLDGNVLDDENKFLGFRHNQISVIPTGEKRELVGWYNWWGKNKHSILPIYLANLLFKRPLSLSASTNGSPRPIVPIGVLDKVLPLDILATPLMKALVVGDLEAIVNLGGLELLEEDLALASYVCPSKYEYGPILRDNLERISKEY
jgi:Na+-transporting NADH:ubiquinone oxidoreductase subunit A